MDVMSTQRMDILANQKRTIGICKTPACASKSREFPDSEGQCIKRNRKFFKHDFSCWF